MQKKSRVPLKAQKLVVGYILALLLAYWSIGAMWRHIDGLESDYGWMMKVGVLAGEFAVFVLITWHVLRRWIWTRLYCLLASVVLGGALIIHAAGVIKADANKVESKQLIGSLAEGQSKITQGATTGIVGGATQGARQLRRQGATTREAGRLITNANQQAAKVGTEANKQFTEAATKINEQQTAQNFMSRSYLNGPMYAVIFCLALALMGVGYLILELGAAEEDDDADGVPNYADTDSAHFNRERASQYWADRGQAVPGQVVNGRDRATQNP